MHFKDLGLVVVDEEQRFGVAAKERLKQLRREVDVLTLSATPIPRTLNLALSGIRDMSVIETPPEDRLPIQTRVAEASAGLESSVPGLFAAGDIAEYDSPVLGRPLRIEHWDVAFNHGKTAALNMLGRDVAHEEIPYFFSDLADWASSEYVGPGSGDVVVRGSMDDGEFTAFYVDPDSGAVTAALTVGRSDDLEHARRFIREKTAPERGGLADAGSDLAEM